jgi:hypothetical protein
MTMDYTTNTPRMTAAEAATYLKRRFVLREAAAGRLRAARIGGRGNEWS